MTGRYAAIKTEHSANIAVTLDRHFEFRKLNPQTCCLRGNHRRAACGKRSPEKPSRIRASPRTAHHRWHIGLNLLAGRSGNAASQSVLQRSSGRGVLSARLFRIGLNCLAQTVQCTCNRGECHDVPPRPIELLAGVLLRSCINCDLRGNSARDLAIWQCPLWVISRHSRAFTQCPLCAKSGHSELQRRSFYSAVSARSGYAPPRSLDRDTTRLEGPLQRTISSATNLRKCSGLRCSGCVICSPSCVKRSRTSGRSSALLSAALSSRTIGSGVFWARNRPCQVMMTKSTPCSRTVGTCASVYQRCSPVVAIALTKPPSICGFDVDGESHK